MEQADFFTPGLLLGGERRECRVIYFDCFAPPLVISRGQLKSHPRTIGQGASLGVSEVTIIAFAVVRLNESKSLFCIDLVHLPRQLLAGCPCRRLRGGPRGVLLQLLGAAAVHHHDVDCRGALAGRVQSQPEPHSRTDGSISKLGLGAKVTFPVVRLNESKSLFCIDLVHLPRQLLAGCPCRRLRGRPRGVLLQLLGAAAVHHHDVDCRGALAGRVQSQPEPHSRTDGSISKLGLGAKVTFPPTRPDKSETFLRMNALHRSRVTVSFSHVNHQRPPGRWNVTQLVQSLVRERFHPRRPRSTVRAR
mmetsp:Transcript_92874/g.248484  ORF Transcript_92874/g.248484 Transcript_92874/m.248484 type:complete len:305 (-) Transcript_92874:110-1024(-)